MTDKELIKKIKSGHTELLADIIERYYDDILRFCRYQTGDGAGSYDLTQETFLKFIKYVESYQSLNLKGYLLTIARNLCRNYFREKSPAFVREREIPEEMGKEEEGFDRVHDRLVLKELLARLPEEQREVIILRYYHELKLSEISKISGVKLSTVKTRLRLATAAMKKEIGKGGLS